MSPQQAVEQAKTKFNNASEHLKSELSKLRTGRATASMLDSVTVVAYGTPTPLNPGSDHKNDLLETKRRSKDWY